jgi:hypothetical protein
MGLGATFLSKARQAREVIAVPTPELGEDCPQVYVRTLSGKESDAYELSALEFDADTGKATPVRGNNTARFCCFALCDAEGKRLYTLEDVDDLGELVPRPILLRIYDAAARVNKMRKEDQEELKNGCSPQESNGSCGTASQPTTDAPTGS